MPKVVIRREGLELEADLTLDQIKELAGFNGVSHRLTTGHRPATVRPIKQHSVRIADFPAFFDEISERARKFIKILSDHPRGIEAHDLASLLGFTKPAQIGGLTGPGISKIAEKHGIKPGDIYKSQVIFPEGKRKRMFYPGDLTLQATQQTPLLMRG